MIICMCNAKNCRTVKQVLESRPDIATPQAVHQAMGCKPQCGRCLPTLADMIRETRDQQNLNGLIAAD